MVEQSTKWSVIIELNKIEEVLSLLQVIIITIEWLVECAGFESLVQVRKCSELYLRYFIHRV